jgi:hypothetical protein
MSFLSQEQLGPPSWTWEGPRWAVHGPGWPWLWQWRWSKSAVCLFPVPLAAGLSSEDCSDLKASLFANLDFSLSHHSRGLPFV